jgi:4-amino-4-deoxy-L-arabinose transferase-like glycosyltransferase
MSKTRTRTLALVALAAVAGLALLVRVPSIAEPLGIDQGLFASAARGLARGQVLYRDVWDQRPPGIVLTYLAAFRVFGWTPASVAWIDILASAATTLLLVAAVRRLGGAAMGLVAAVLYAALTMPAWLYRYGGLLERAASETLIVVCVAFGAWCATRLCRRSSAAWASGFGLAMGAAAVIKPNAVVYLPALLAWVALYQEDRAPGAAQRQLVRTACIAVVASLIVPGLTAAWLWRHDVLRDAWIAVVDFNRAYLAERLTISGFAINFSKAVWLRIKTDPLWLAGSVAALGAVWELLRRKRLDPVAALAVLWGGAAALVILVNGARLFSTYFIQAMPPLAVLAAWGFADAARRSVIHRVFAAATAALMLVLLAQRGYFVKVYISARADLDQVIGRTDRAAYLQTFGGYANGRGYSARANAELAAYVRDHTAADDLIYLFGNNGSEVYFSADRLTANRFLRITYILPPKLDNPGFRFHTVIEELAARRPVYLIFERIDSDATMGGTLAALPQDPDVARLLEAYRIETRIEDFTLYRRVK